MNAADDDADFTLQKLSSDLITDLDKALVTYLRKPEGNGGTRVRSFVRARDTFTATCNVIDTFQELPQLLDPHLTKWIPFLAQSYLEDLANPRRSSAEQDTRVKSKAMVPVSFAIAKILYTFCKVRGEKVIVRFLNAEAKYLELLLSSFEEAETRTLASPKADCDALLTPDQGWAWEQRYIVLLWLSHLLLVPFDLATISSVGLEENAVPKIEGLQLHDDLPGITLRILPLAIKYLAIPGKERDSAKALLVRMAMRKDMQALGVLSSLVGWALASLRPQQGAEPRTTYFYLGILSFLAGILRSSSETSDMNVHLAQVFNAVHALTFNDTDVSKAVNALALARKMMIKIIRSVVVTFLRRGNQDMQSMEVTETAIGYLFQSLSDNDTPVRMSASKSLSVITLKLDPDMASQVVEAVLESLNRNVLWNKDEIKQGARPVRDLSAVSHLEWHGLILTLSHLLYRRSPPAEKLSDIIHALILALSFEQRALSGGSVGANVRDAACFGVWALARRYTTAELVAVPIQSVFAAKPHPSSSSIIQVLATKLVMAACLDPFGNIRRGSSAALQELVGRHPDTVERGISVVQNVDYYAVARRSRAIQQVASNATKLASPYGEALLDGILGWRGVGDMDAPSRRDSGVAFGTLTTLLGEHSSTPSERFRKSFDMVQARLKSLATRNVEERHGLLLCLASLLDQFPEFAQPGTEVELAKNGISAVCSILQDCHDTTYRRPELIAEAASRLSVSTVPLLQTILLEGRTTTKLEPGEQLLSPTRPGLYLDFLDAARQATQRDSLIVMLADKLAQVVEVWLDFPNTDTIKFASTAALLLLILSTDDNRSTLLLEWAKFIQYRPATRAAIIGQGYFHVLAMAQPLAEATSHNAEWDDVVSEAFLARWIADRQVETRVSILESLIRARVLCNKPLAFMPLLVDGLDDYTANARGDVGSLVRVQALKAVQVLWENISDAAGEEDWVVQSVEKLFYRTLRLSVEKLDRVRPEAQIALSLVIQKSCETTHFGQLSPSSQAYFERLLELLPSGQLHRSVTTTATSDPVTWMSQLMAGLVTSADTGQEDLVITSRAAMTAFCQASPENLRLVCSALICNLKTYQTEDRTTVPTLEVIAYLFYTGLFQQSPETNLRSLCLQTQKVGYKTGNVRKILACIKVYGCVAGFGSTAFAAGQAEGGAAAAAAVVEQGGPAEARKRLGVLMLHPWPRVRMAVVDQLWALLGDQDGDVGEELLLGVDWGTADKAKIRAVVEKLQLA